MRIDFDRAIERFQQLLDGLITAIPGLIAAGFVLLFFWLLSRFLGRAIHRVADRASHSRHVGWTLARLSNYALMILGTLIALSAVFPDFKAGQVISLLGIGGVAVGFAFKEILQNFLAGLIILVVRPFKIGDTISVTTYEGVVEDIQTRVTILRTPDNQQVQIPNTVLYTNAVVVLNAYRVRRMEFDLGLDAWHNVEDARRAIAAAMKTLKGVEKKPAPVVSVLGYSESRVDLRVYWWIDSSRQSVHELAPRLLEELQATLKEQGIEIALPIRMSYGQEPAAHLA